MSATCFPERLGLVSRNPRQCALCFEPIVIGEKYDRRSGVSDGDFWTMPMHPECRAHEQTPGAVDRDWYEYPDEPAFKRPAVSDGKS